MEAEARLCVPPLPEDESTSESEEETSQDDELMSCMGMSPETGLSRYTTAPRLPTNAHQFDSFPPFESFNRQMGFQPAANFAPAPMPPFRQQEDWQTAPMVIQH